MAPEKAGQVLWTVQGILVSESVDRHGKRLKDSAGELKAQGKALRRAGERDAADVLDDTVDSLYALVEILQLGVEAGLVGWGEDPYLPASCRV